MIIKVGDTEQAQWDMGTQAAAELLTAIQLVCHHNMHKIEGDGFTVYTVPGTGVRVDLKAGFYE